MRELNEQVKWKLPTGKILTITPDSPTEDKIKAIQLAIKTLQGRYPSINSEETIDQLIDIIK